MHRCHVLQRCCHHWAWRDLGSRGVSGAQEKQKPRKTGGWELWPWTEGAAPARARKWPRPPETSPRIRAPHYTTQECWLGQLEIQRVQCVHCWHRASRVQGANSNQQRDFVGLMAHYLRKSAVTKTNRHLLNGGTVGEAPCCQPAGKQRASHVSGFSFQMDTGSSCG